METKLQTQADPVLTGAVDAVGPWTIKSVARETRLHMIAEARKQGLTVGQWLERFFQDSPSPPESAPVPALVSPSPTGLAEAAQAVEIVKQLWGIPDLPESVRKSALTVLRDRLKQARR